MSEAYTKLFNTIATSTIWSEPLATRVVWITMLAIADRSGEVQASIPGLARVANVSMDECQAALATFLAPDPFSRTPDNEGRRIEAVDGGWRLLNHAKYRAKLDADDRRERKAKWMAESRAKAKATSQEVEKCGLESPQQSTGGQSGHITDAPTDADTEDQKLVTFGDSSPATADDKPQKPLPDQSPCPHEAIIGAYHAALPTLPRVREWTPARQQALRSRWRENPERQNLTWWEGFFAYVARSDFLTGKSSRGNGHSWECSLPWLLKAENFAKVIEGHYENRSAA